MTDVLPPAVQAAIDATNAGDLDRFLDAFTDTGAVDDWGRVFTGRDAIRGWSDDEFIGKRVTLAVTSSTVDATGTTVIAQVGGDGFNGPSTFTFTTAANELATMTIRE